MTRFALLFIIPTNILAYFISTDFLEGQSNSGQMFDVVAVNPMLIDAFDVQISDPNIYVNVSIYKLKTFGSFIGHENNKSDWILLDQQQNILSNGRSQPTFLNYLPPNVKVIIPKLQRQAFYIEVIGSTLEYNEINNLTTGDLLTSNSDIELYVGISNNNDFGNYSINKPFQGRIYFSIIPCDTFVSIKDGGDTTGRVIQYSNPALTHNLCFQTSDDFTCVNPFVNITYQNVGYNPIQNGNNYLSLLYFNNEVYQPSIPTRTCVSYENNPCLIDTCDTGYMDPPIFYSNEIHRITVRNGPSVTNTCNNGGSTTNVSMNVMITINCETSSPTISPTILTTAPTLPSNSPSIEPTYYPTNAPLNISTQIPTISPSITPSVTPTTTPTDTPTDYPSSSPTITPTTTPSNTPIQPPTQYPSASPSNVPTNNPTSNTKNPTKTPSTNPSQTPSLSTPNPSSSPNIDTPANASVPLKRHQTLIIIIILLVIALICVIFCFSVISAYKIAKYKFTIKTMASLATLPNNPSTQSTISDLQSPTTMKPQSTTNNESNIELPKQPQINGGKETIAGLDINKGMSDTDNDDSEGPHITKMRHDDV